VYKGTKLDTYQSVAIKRIEKRKTSMAQFHMIEREVFSLTLSSEVTNGMIVMVLISLFPSSHS
jgi:hypothetical protein